MANMFYMFEIVWIQAIKGFMESTRGLGGANQRLPGLGSDRAPVQLANVKSNDIDEIAKLILALGWYVSQTSNLFYHGDWKVSFSCRPDRDRIRTIVH